jgi:hypothetical protein
VDRFACDWHRLSTTDPLFANTDYNTGNNYFNTIFEKKKYIVIVFGKLYKKTGLIRAADAGK